MAVARVFLKELARLGAIPVDITINTKDFKKSRKHTREGLAQDDVMRVFQYLSTLSDTRETTRLKAMYFLFAHQGLRGIEVSRLNVPDLNLANATALIQGKGKDGKELIYLEKMTVEALKTYMNQAKAKSGPLFVSFGNRSNDRLTVNHIQRLFRVVLRALGLNVGVHAFRHFYVTSLLNNGIDLRDVQKFSRHSNVDTVTIYDDELDIRTKTEKVFKVFEKLYAV